MEDSKVKRKQATPMRDLPTLATCPWCGHVKHVYIRAGGELVCTDCATQAAALDATAGDDHDA